MFWQHHGVEKKDLLVPGSILLGAVIIAVSICWSVAKISPDSVAAANLNQGLVPVPGQKILVDTRKDAPKLGNGKIEIIEFTDFQCPFCQQFFNQTYSQIKSKYINTGKAVLTIRHFPLVQLHKNAQKASEAAECANRQGKFFPYHDLLFAKMQPDGTGLNIADLKRYALDLGLDTTRFNQCLDKGETASAVKADLEAGQKAGVTGTPTFFINGEKVVGALPFAAFETVIEKF